MKILDTLMGPLIERRRRRGGWGVGRGVGSGEGAVPPLQKIFSIADLKMVSFDAFCQFLCGFFKV